MKKFVSMLFVLGLWAGGAHASSEFQQALDDARAALRKADSVGFEWRDSGKILDKAREAKEEGKADLALELANEARAQGELAYRQWREQKGAGPTF